jgi:hypothetical protein
MAQEGIATLPMQGMPAPQESQGIGAFEPQATDVPEVSEQDRFEAVMQALRQQLPEIADKVEQILDEANLTPEQVEGLAYVVDFLEKNKDNYSAALQSLVSQGVIGEGELPPEYNEEFMVLLKMVVYGYQSRDMNPEPVPFAKGGLAQAAEALRQQGRGGDTILAHINPEEARLLKRMGGSGTINPNTGLPEFLKFKGVVGGITKAVSGVVGGAAKAVGGAVKSVVGAASKVLGPQLTSIVATVGGFMIGGPAGAALAQGLVTYGQGGSLKDVLLNSATAYIGGAYGPTAGAIAGGGATMLRGGSLKDAVKAAAISYGTSYAMGKMGELGSQGQAPEGTNLSRAGTIDAQGNFVPDAGVATPGSVSAVNPTGTGQPSVLTPGQVSAAAPSGTTSQFGINAGPAPGAPSAPTAGGSQFGSLNYQPPSYALNAPAAAPSGISSLGGAPAASSPGFFNSLMSGNFSDAGTAALNYAKANPVTTAGMILGGTALAGGFTPQPVAPPGIVERGPGGRPLTGEDVIANDPSKYIVQNIPGVSYNPQGGIDFTRNTVAPTQFNITPSPMYGVGPTVAGSPLYGTPPTYQAPTGSVGTTPNTGIAQPYNTAGMYDFMNYNPYAPRRLNMGGPVVMYNQGGATQYPRKTGQISGPGTETSDDIPAMLSDGEFVITAKAVRGIGNGSRRAGAKKLYRMMHAMEKKAGGKV